MFPATLRIRSVLAGLPCISKVYERAIHDQLMDFLDKHFHPLLSAFRPGFGCQTAL